MSSVNKVIVVGRVGKDPEVRVFQNGNKGANFTVAVSESYKNKEGQKVENTEWVPVSVFGKIADIVEKYVKKGSLIYVEGKFTTRSYESKTGEKRYTTEVTVKDFGHTIQLLGSKSDNQGQRSSQPTYEPEPLPEKTPPPGEGLPGGEDDLPF